MCLASESHVSLHFSLSNKVTVQLLTRSKLPNSEHRRHNKRGCSPSDLINDSCVTSSKRDTLRKEITPFLESWSHTGLGIRHGGKSGTKTNHSPL